MITVFRVTPRKHKPSATPCFGEGLDDFGLFVGLSSPVQSRWFQHDSNTGDGHTQENTVSTPPRNAAAPVEETEATKERASQTPHQDSTLEPLAPLVASKRWVGWGGGESRAPLRAPGAPASSNDPTTWATLDEVRRWSPEHFGIVTGKGNHNRTLIAIDVDALKGSRPEDPATPREIIRAAYADDGWAEELDEFAASLGILGHPPMERSPSRAGVHAFVLVEGAPDLGHRKTFNVGPFKVEILAAQYCTVTRDWICENPLQPVPWDDFRLWFKVGLKANPDAILKNPPRPQQTSSYESTLTEDEELERAADALSYMDADDYDTWVEMGMALKAEFGERGRAVWDTWGSSSSKYDPKKADEKWASFKREGLGIGTLYLRAKQNGYVPPKPEPKTTEQSQKAEDGQSAQWGEFYSLDKPSVPKFPRDVLPGELGDYAKALSKFSQTPLDLAASMLLGAVSTAAMQSYDVRVKDNHVEPLCLFFCTLLETGLRKSPVFNPAMAPLVAWEKEARERWKFRVSELRQIEHPDARAELEELLAAGAPRLFTEDASLEKVEQMAAQNGERIAILSDESTPLDNMKGRYSNSVPHFTWLLKAYTGSPSRVDRMGREGTAQDNPRATVVLTMQPSNIQHLPQEMHDKGLVARFLWSMPEVRLGHMEYDVPPVPPVLELQYNRLIGGLLARRDAARTILERSAEAERVFRDYLLLTQRELREGGRLVNAVAWANKRVTAALRLAGLFHLVSGEGDEISGDAMERGVQLMEFYTEQAFVVFDYQNGTQDTSQAREVCEWFKSRGLAEFTKNELYQSVKRRAWVKSNVKSLEEPLNLLIQHGYLRHVRKEGPGRPSDVFAVNPAVYA